MAVELHVLVLSYSQVKQQTPVWWCHHYHHVDGRRSLECVLDLQVDGGKIK